MSWQEDFAPPGYVPPVAAAPRVGQEDDEEDLRKNWQAAFAPPAEVKPPEPDVFAQQQHDLISAYSLRKTAEQQAEGQGAALREIKNKVLGSVAEAGQAIMAGASDLAGGLHGAHYEIGRRIALEGPEIQQKYIDSLGVAANVSGTPQSVALEEFYRAKRDIEQEGLDSRREYRRKQKEAPAYFDSAMATLTQAGVPEAEAKKKAKALTDAWLFRDPKASVAPGAEPRFDSPVAGRVIGAAEGILSSGLMAAPALKAGQLGAAAAGAGAPVSDAIAEAFNADGAGDAHQAQIERQANSMTGAAGALAGIGAGTTRVLRAIPGVGQPLAAAAEAIAGGLGRAAVSLYDPELGADAREGMRMPAMEAGKAIAPDDPKAAAGAGLLLSVSDTAAVPLAEGLAKGAKAVRGARAAGDTSKVDALRAMDAAVSANPSPAEKLQAEIAAARDRVEQASKAAGARVHVMEDSARETVLNDGTLAQAAQSKAEAAAKKLEAAKAAYGKLLMGEDAPAGALDGKYDAKLKEAEKAVAKAEETAAATSELAAALNDLKAKQDYARAAATLSVETGRAEPVAISQIPLDQRAAPVQGLEVSARQPSAMPVDEAAINAEKAAAYRAEDAALPPAISQFGGVPARTNIGPGVQVPLAERRLAGAMSEIPDAAPIAGRGPALARPGAVDLAGDIADTNGNRLAAAIDQLSYSKTGAAAEAGEAGQVAGSQLKPESFMPKLVSSAVRKAGEARLAGKLNDESVAKLSATLSPEDRVDLAEQIKSADLVRDGWRPGPSELASFRNKPGAAEAARAGLPAEAGSGARTPRAGGLASTPDTRLAQAQEKLRAGATRKDQLSDVAAAMEMLNEARVRTSKLNSKDTATLLISRAFGSDKAPLIMAGAALGWDMINGRDKQGHEHGGMTTAPAGLGAAGILAAIGLNKRSIMASADEIAIIDRLASAASAKGIPFNADSLAEWLRAAAPGVREDHALDAARQILERRGITQSGVMMPKGSLGGQTFAARVQNHMQDEERALIDQIGHDGLNALNGEVHVPTLEGTAISAEQHLNAGKRPFFLQWLPEKDGTKATRAFLNELQVSGNAAPDSLVDVNLGIAGDDGPISAATAMYTALNKTRIGHTVTASAERGHRIGELWKYWSAKGAAAMPSGSAQAMVGNEGFARIYDDIKKAGVSWDDFIKYFRHHDNYKSPLNKMTKAERAAMEAANPALPALRDRMDAWNKARHDVSQPSIPYEKGYVMTAYDIRSELLNDLNKRRTALLAAGNDVGASVVGETISRIKSGGGPSEWLPEAMLKQLSKTPLNAPDKQRLLMLDGIVQRDPELYAEAVGDVFKRRMSSLSFEPEANRLRKMAYQNIGKAAELQDGGLVKFTKKHADMLSLYIDNALGVLGRKSWLDGAEQTLAKVGAGQDARYNAARRLSAFAAFAYLARPMFLTANRLSTAFKGIPRMGLVPWLQAEIAPAAAELNRMLGMDAPLSKRVMKAREDLGVAITETQASGHLTGTLDVPPTNALESAVDLAKRGVRRATNPLSYSETNIKGIMSARRVIQVEDAVRWVQSKLRSNKSLAQLYAKDGEAAVKLLLETEKGKVPSSLLINDVRFPKDRQVRYWMDVAMADAQKAGTARDAALAEGRRMYSDLFHEYGTLARGGITMRNRSLDIAARMQTYLNKEIAYYKTLTPAAKTAYWGTALTLGGPLALGPIMLLVQHNDDAREEWRKVVDGQRGWVPMVLARANVVGMLQTAAAGPDKDPTDQQYSGLTPMQVQFPGMEMPRGFKNNGLSLAAYATGLVGGIPTQMIAEPALRVLDAYKHGGAREAKQEVYNSTIGRNMPIKSISDVASMIREHNASSGSFLSKLPNDILRVFAQHASEDQLSGLSSELRDEARRTKGIGAAIADEVISSGTVAPWHALQSARLKEGLSGTPRRNMEQALMAGNKSPFIESVEGFPITPAGIPVLSDSIRAYLDGAASGEPALQESAPAIVPIARQKLISALRATYPQMAQATSAEQKAELAAAQQDYRHALSDLEARARSMNLPLVAKPNTQSWSRFQEMVASIPADDARNERMLQQAVRKKIWEMGPVIDKANFSMIASSWSVKSKLAATDGPYMETWKRMNQMRERR